VQSNTLIIDANYTHVTDLTKEDLPANLINYHNEESSNKTFPVNVY